MVNYIFEILLKNLEKSSNAMHLKYLSVFLGVFFVFFAMYSLLISNESVGRTKWHRNWKVGTWSLYMDSKWILSLFSSALKTTSGFVKKLEIAKKGYFSAKLLFFKHHSLPQKKDSIMKFAHHFLMFLIRKWWKNRWKIFFSQARLVGWPFSNRVLVC